MTIDFEAARRFKEQHSKDCPIRKMDLGQRLMLRATMAVDDNRSITLPGGCCELRASYEMA